MNLPKDSDLIGSNSEMLTVQGAGVHTVVKLTTEGQHKLNADLLTISGDTLHKRLYLSLENIRGNWDASVLSVYINLPEDENLEVPRRFPIGSVGLYGLSDASLSNGSNKGLGLTSMFDITQTLIELFALVISLPSEIHIHIVPNQPLPDTSDVIIERISLSSLPIN